MRRYLQGCTYLYINSSYQIKHHRAIGSSKRILVLIVWHALQDAKQAKKEARKEARKEVEPKKADEATIDMLDIRWSFKIKGLQVCKAISNVNFKKSLKSRSICCQWPLSLHIADSWRGLHRVSFWSHIWFESPQVCIPVTECFAFASICLSPVRATIHSWSIQHVNDVNLDKSERDFVLQDWPDYRCVTSPKRRYVVCRADRPWRRKTSPGIDPSFSQNPHKTLLD